MFYYGEGALAQKVTKELQLVDSLPSCSFLPSHLLAVDCLAVVVVGGDSWWVRYHHLCAWVEGIGLLIVRVCV